MPTPRAKAGDIANSHAGFIFQKGALDFAGGTVVHINSGIAALVAALMLGPRKGYGKVPMPPHSLMMTAIGTGMLWMGWFGFNAGSALEATGAAGLAFFNTLFGVAVAGVTWAIVEWIVKGKPSLLGICSGIVAGLVAITPAAGFVGVGGALVVCAVAAVICFFAVTYLKAWLGYDDSLDTFGVHCVGGIIGSLGTGIFVNPAFGGTGVYDYVANKVGDFDANGTDRLPALGHRHHAGVVRFRGLRDPVHPEEDHRHTRKRRSTGRRSRPGRPRRERLQPLRSVLLEAQCFNSGHRKVPFFSYGELARLMASAQSTQGGSGTGMPVRCTFRDGTMQAGLAE